MQITQRLVKEVKRSDRKAWHDKEWHTFQSKKEVEAIHYAIDVQKAEGYAEIVKEAKKYLA